MWVGWTGVDAKAMGMMMAMQLAKSMPGQRWDFGRLSEIQELVRVKKMVRRLI